MKIHILCLSLLVLVLGLTACDKTEPETPPIQDTPPAATVEEPDKDLDTDLEEPDVEIETPEPQEVEVEASEDTLSDDDALLAYKDMVERFKNESPVDVYNDVLNLLPKMPSTYSSMLFAKFDVYLENWSLNYTDQIYFEDGPMKGLNLSLVAAYDYETDTYDLNKIENTTHQAITQSLMENGFKFIWLEGDPYPFVDYSALKVLNESVPEEVMAFILVMATESDQITAADAGLVIGWNELSKRIIHTENAMKIIYNETLFSKLESLYRFYCSAYLLGMNNTPVVDWSSNKMLEEVLDSYERTLSNSPDSQLVQILNDYLPAVRNMDYTLPYSDQDTFQSFVKMQSDLIDNAVEKLHAHHSH